MTLRNNAWTDEVYQLASFLYYEPQHIGKRQISKGSIQIHNDKMANLRKLEVPLNYLFNIVMRLLPQRLKRQVLSCFVSPSAATFGQKIEYVNSFEQSRLHELSFIQLDTVLASEQAHICLELKVTAKLSLKQVYKYLCFLGHWQAESKAAKTPFLFFLTQECLYDQWNRHERHILTEGNELASLANYLRTAQILKPDYQEMVQLILQDVHFGWATWQTVGASLQEALVSLSGADSDEGGEVLENLLGDFLQELKQRGLWNPPQQVPIQPKEA